jgi:dynein heavy chain
VVVKKTFKKKEEILPVQNASVCELKFALDRFNTFIRVFRAEFRANAPFKFSGSITDAHNKLDTYDLKLREIESQVSQFHGLEELFELQQTNYLEIGDTHVEIKYLRILWDCKAMADQIFADWRKTLWNDVDTDSIEEKNMKLRQQLKEKGNTFSTMKGWQVYKDIEETMDVMAVVLPLINDLHSEAMRPRY